MKTLFITGTDTDVGKTVVTAIIAQLSHELGLSVSVIKPFQTGTDDYPTDLESIQKIINFSLFPIPQEIALPCAFPVAASPHLAAEIENEVINYSNILEKIKTYQNNSGRPDILLIEGAGGLFVPITRTYYMIDFIKALNVPVILASRAGLGTINHTLLSLEALQNRDVPIAGVVLNQTSKPPTQLENDNMRVINAYSKTPVLARIESANLEHPQTITSYIENKKALTTLLTK